MPEQPELNPDVAAPPQVPAPATVDEPAMGVHDQPTLSPESASTPGGAPAVQPAPDPGRLARRFGDYELLGEIARGGMGIVYRARERQSGRLVALKMMLADSALDSNYVQRFALEARATGELSHTGIVAIHTWGQHEGQFFYTMDYVPGFPLSRILKRRPLALPRAVRYLLGVARAVAVAHAQGIVHRDLKPSNIVIDPTDQPRVLDFGLAKRHRQATALRDQEPVEVEVVDDVVDALPADAVLPSPTDSKGSKDNTPPRTERGAVLGTPAYMAPEQARGEHSKVGPAADVHALGAIFFEMLTGRPPFEAATMMDTLIQVMEQEPPALRGLNPDVPIALAHVCRRCLEKDPRDRYPNAGTLAEDLDRCWRRAAQRRRFARLTAISGLVFGVMLFIRLVVLNRESLTLDALSQMAHNKAVIGGPMLQGAASILGVLLGFVLGLIPYLALLAFLVWLGAWLGHSGWWARREREETEPPGSQSESYLRKLFAVGGDTQARDSAQAGTRGAIELGDVEFTKTLFESAGCVVRKGKQKSLDRPVLVWLDPRLAPTGAPVPGVVVRHASALNLHAVGTCPEGQFLVTEPAVATPLAELLERRSLEPLEAVFMIVKVAHALQAFHDQGVCHGRLSSDWILVGSDLEPFLCPCGVPSQALDDRKLDVRALGWLLRDWLPKRPRRWRHSPLAMLYQVCDAAEAGEYERPADLARDLERAARAANVRWWERLGSVFFLVLWAVPMLAALIGLVANYFAGDVAAEHAGAEQVSRFILEHLMLILAPSAMLLGFVQSWGLVQSFRLRLRCLAFDRILKGKIIFMMVQAVIIMAVPAVMACFELFRLGHAAGPLVWLLGTTELLGFWLVGICITGLVTFGEFLVRSVRARASEEIAGSAALAGAATQQLPSPREAARTFGGRTRW